MNLPYFHHDHPRALRAYSEDHQPSIDAIRDFLHARDQSIPNSHPGVEGLIELMERHPFADRDMVHDYLSYRPAPESEDAI